MQIFVKTQTGETICTLDVMASNTIDHVKDKIKDKEWIPQNQQRLTYRGELLQGESTIGSYHVDNRGTLVLQIVSGVQIFVQTQLGETIALDDMKARDAIDNVKRKIQDLLGIPPYKMRLIFAGVLLENGRTLSEYNVPPNSQLTLEGLGTKNLNYRISRS